MIHRATFIETMTSRKEASASEPPTDSSTPKGWGSSRLSSSDCLLAWLKWKGSSSERALESVAHRKATGGNIGGRLKTSQAKERLVIRLRSEGCS